MATVKRLPLSELKIDKRYQRDLQQPRINKIVKNFDERQLGVLEVSQRNGKASVIDGQHRLAALRKLKSEKVLCLVHSDLTPEEEAALFVHFQMDRRNLKAWERFRAQVFSGDESAVQIQATAEACGYKIGDSHGTRRNDTIEAVVSLEHIYRKLGPAMLRETLQTLHRLWFGDPGSTNAYIIKGLAFLLRDYGDRLTSEHEDRLSEIAPKVILRRVLGRGVYGGGEHAHNAVARELRKVAKVQGRPRSFKKAA